MADNIIGTIVVKADPELTKMIGALVAAAEKIETAKAAAPKETKATKAPKETKATKAEAPKEEEDVTEATASEEDDFGDVEAKPSLTRDQVLAQLKKYAALEGKPAAVKILKDHGAKNIAELDEAQFQKVFDAAS